MSCLIKILFARQSCCATVQRAMDWIPSQASQAEGLKNSSWLKNLFFKSRKDKRSEKRRMGFIFHILCPRIYGLCNNTYYLPLCPNSHLSRKMALGNLYTLTLLHSEQPKLYGVLAVLSARGLMDKKIMLENWIGKQP